MDIKKYLNVGLFSVQEAEKIIRKGKSLHGKIPYERKADGTPVTKYDVAAEKRMKAIICPIFPTHTVHGEETKEKKGTSLYRWDIDPIDGSWAYIKNDPNVATSLSLSYDNKVILYIINNPLTQDLFYGGQGLISKLDDQPLPFDREEGLQNAVCQYQFSGSKNQERMKLYELLVEEKIGKLVNNGGSIAYHLAQIAAGTQAAYILNVNYDVNPFAKAGIALVRSVGGLVTDLDRKNVDISGPCKFLVASNNPSVHDQLLNQLSVVGFNKN